MKKIISLIAILLLLTPMVLAELSSTTASLKVISLRYEPYPIEPGESFKIWIKLENSGVDTGDSVTFELLPQFPFSIEEPLTEIGKLDVGEEVVLEYQVKADINALSGENELKGKYCINTNICVTHIFRIDIQSRDAIINIADVTAMPNEIAPGEQATVKIKLNNLAESLMKNIRVKLDLYEKLTTATAITYNELPFTPIGSSNELSINKIEKGESDEVTFKLIADPDAEIKVYKIPVILTYTDEAGNNFTREYITALIINDEPDIYATVDETTVPSGGGTGIVDIKFINKGLSDVKFLDVELKDTDDYNIISSDKVYVGNLDSDDYETADFKIKTSTREKVINLEVNIKYRDAINNEYEDDLIVELNLQNSTSTGQSGFSKGTIVFIIVLIAIGVFFFLRWRRCKKTK